MKLHKTPTALLIAMILCLALGHTTMAQEASSPKGMRCFFAGHSFFCPVAISFDRIARENDFEGHDVRLVFRGGQAGTAGALWSAPKARKQIEAVLATGTVELFGLTPGLSDNAETFQRWFDLALEHNPKTRFFIGTPWAMGGANMDTVMFDRLVTGYANKCDKVVKELRTQYPDNEIDFLAYGKMAVVMKERHDSETLPDITKMTGAGKDAFFTDERPGHAGPMLLDLCAVTWLNELYGADIDTLEYGTHEADTTGMIKEVMTFNAPFRHDPKRDTGPMTTVDEKTDSSD